MARFRLVVTTLLVALLIGAGSIVAVAQDDSATPEGSVWQLTQFAADGALVAVPEGISASLLLQDGQASGSAGCNTFSGTYRLDGQSIAFGPDVASTKILCAGDAQVVEDAYLAALPTVTAWAIADGALSLSDGDSTVRLVFETSGAALAPTDLERILALLVGMQAQVGALESRLAALEGGTASAESPGGGSTQKLKKPKAPTRNGGKVETKFPDWMRDEFRPQSERSDDKNRELVTWKKGKGGAIDGSRIYVRRGYCALKPGVNANQELDPDKDFTTRTGKAILIDELPSSTKRYRPNHAQVDAALPAAPESPYSNDQYYDVLVSTFNGRGESAKTKVASFYLTPEFRCP